MYEVDRSGLARAVAAAFGLDPPDAGIPPPRVVGAGRLLTPGGGYPCLLAFPHAGEDADAQAARLIAAGEAPFVLLAPTRRWAGRHLEPRLRLHQAAFVPLAGAVAPAGRGRLRAARPLADLVARALGMTARAPVVPPADPTRNAFRSEGDGWGVVYAGRRITLKNDLGARYLAHLIGTKHRPVPAAVLRAAVLGGRVVPPAAGAEVLDRAGLEAARDAHANLARELDDAVACNDPGRADRVRAEMTALAAHMAAATGLGGRRRKVGDEGESIRVSVKGAIDRVIARLRNPYPELARHFEASVRTGMDVCYAPSPDVEWDL